MSDLARARRELDDAHERLNDAQERWKAAVRDAMREPGASLRKVAAEAGCSYERVRQILRE